MTNGHNLGIDPTHLRSFIDRLERLEEKKKEITDDIKEVYAEAKGVGFDTKTMRKIIAMRKIDDEKRREQQAMIDLYLAALGDLVETPLGQSAIAREFATT